MKESFKQKDPVEDLKRYLKTKTFFITENQRRRAEQDQFIDYSSTLDSLTMTPQELIEEGELRAYKRVANFLGINE